MASAANHFCLARYAKETSISTTTIPKLSTSSSHLSCFQSGKFLCPRSCVRVSLLSAGQGRSPRVFADSAQAMDHFTITVNAVPSIFDVDSGDRSYPIYIASGLLDKPELLQRGNPNISVESVILPDGDQYKDMDTLSKVELKAHPEFDQRDTFVSLGGGVISDICGFAASHFVRRRINFIQIPTTVMAQVDSSVGGKNRINRPYKTIYAVCQPQSVLIDTDTLNTLPDRGLASGFAEVIKYGLIRDAQFFEWLEKNMQSLMARDPSALAYAIKRSCEIKAEVISLDEKQTGLGATLDLGHTFGRAIETRGGFGQWLHGEAVAAGMGVAVDLSHRLGWIDDSSVQRVHAILKQANLPTAPPENMTMDMFKRVMTIMMIRREMVDEGVPKLILPRGPLGNCVFTRDYDRNALDATLHKFCKS